MKVGCSKRLSLTKTLPELRFPRKLVFVPSLISLCDQDFVLKGVLEILALLHVNCPPKLCLIGFQF